MRNRMAPGDTVVDFISETCAAFLAHWRSLPRQGLVPPSRAFLDSAPPAFMPNVFLHDVEEAGLRVRFMGTALVERWRRDHTGRLLGEDAGETARMKLRAQAVRIVEQPCGLHQLGRLMTSSGRPIHFEAVLLPLLGEPGRPQ